MVSPYTNNFKGRTNRQEKAKHLRDEFTRIQAAFSSLSVNSQTGFNNIYTNSVPFLGALTLDPANGYLQEVTLTTTTTIIIKDPVGNTTKRVALVIHGSNKKVINGWGPQTWKEHGPNDWIIAYTGAGRYASMLIEFYWDGKAWMATIAGKNQNIDLVSDATQAIFPFTTTLTDLDSLDTLVLTRASPANVFDHLGNLVQRQTGVERFAGSRYVHNWVATPSDLQSVAWEATNVTVATASAAGPASEDVDKLTFTTVGGEVGCWMLPHFGRNGRKADPIKIAVRFQAKMSAVSTGTMRVVVALMGAQGETTAVHEAITVILSSTWTKFGHTFDIVTNKDLDSFDLTNPLNQRTLVKVAFKSPSGALGDPVLVTNVQAEILRRGESTVPSEMQDGTIGSSITLTATGASTGAWNDGTKALTLDIGEFVDFQDSLAIGKTYLAVPVLSAGSSANILMLKDQMFWRAYVETGGDSKYVQDAPFTFRYEGGVFKFELQHGASATYALNIYECSAQTGVYGVGKEEQVSSTHVMTSALGEYVQAQLGDGLAHESAAVTNLIAVGSYRNFDDWTKVNLTNAPDVGGVITSQQSEYGIDGLPMHGTAIQATDPTALGYLSLITTIPSNSSTYTFTVYVRKTFDDAGARVVDAQQAQLAVSSSASRYIGFACKLGTSIGGEILVLDIAKASLGSSTSYSTLITEIGDWIKVSIGLVNSSQTAFEVRLYPAIDVGGTDVTKTGWAIIDWAQLEQETGDVSGSLPVVGGETRAAESFASTLANGTLYDANANEIGDITSLVWTFNTEGEHKSVLYSTSQVVSTYGAKHLHEFGPAIPLVCVEALQDTLGSALLDTNGNGLCAETSNALEPNLTGLEYYWDFEQLHYALDASTSTGYWSIAPLMGYGTNWYTFRKDTNVSDASAAGLHNNNAISFPGTNISRRLSLQNVEYTGDRIHIDAVMALTTTGESTVAFWVYVGGLSAIQTILSCGDHGRNEGPHISINTDGTVEWAAGDGNTPYDHSLIETVTTVNNAVNASAWNLVVIKHAASTKTVGISINGSTFEAGTYTRALASSTVTGGVYLGCRFFDNSTTLDQPILAGGRLNYLALWGSELAQAVVDAIYNLGKGLDNTQFFGAESYWPAGGWHNGINSRTQTPELHLDISNSYSVYTTASPQASDRATLDGADVEYMLSSGILNNGMDSGFSIPAKLKTNIQNGLNVLRFTGNESYDATVVPPSHAALGSQFTFFFAGSVTSGVIFDIGSKNFPGTVGLADPHPYIEADAGGGLTFQDSVISVAMDAADKVGAGVFFIGAVQFIPSPTGPPTNGTVKVWINGNLKKTDTSTADDAYTEHTIETTSVIGDRQSTTLPAHTQEFVGDLGEIILYKEALTDDNVRSVMNWMNDKWAAY